MNLVEFALILPLLAAIIVGLADLGRAVYYYNTVANAAREGARFAVVLGPDDFATPGNASGSYTASSYVGTATIAGHAAAMTAALDPSKIQLTVVADASHWYKEPITVTVSYPFSPAFASIVRTGPFTVTAAASMVMN